MEAQIISFFWNSAERRLRALWRLLIQGFLWFGLQIGVGVIVAIIVILLSVVTGWSPGQDIPGSSDRITDLMSQPGITLFLQLVSLMITVGLVGLAGRFLDRRRFADFGFHFSKRWWLDLVFGLFLGAFLMAAVFFIELAAGWIEVEGYFVTTISGGMFPLAILLPAILFLAVGITEELNSRGYQLKNFAEGMKGPLSNAAGAVFLAAIFSSILFGFMHAMNPNITLIALINLMAAGLFLALGYVLTGELAVPIGVHITWNFFQGNVFGFPVSGLEPIAARFVSIRQGGPDWLTGGAFGPEGGVIGLGAMAAGCVLILLWIRLSRGKVPFASTLAVYQGRETKPEQSDSSGSADSTA